MRFSRLSPLILGSVGLAAAAAADETPVFVTAWGSLGTANGQFDSPRGVAAGCGMIWVADLNNHRVQMFTEDGGFLGTVGHFGTGLGEFNGPTDVAASPFVSMGCYCFYVVDQGNHRIQRFCDVITTW